MNVPLFVPCLSLVPRRFPPAHSTRCEMSWRHGKRPRRTRSRGMPFGDVTKNRAKSCEREENAGVLGCPCRIPGGKTTRAVAEAAHFGGKSSLWICTDFPAFSLAYLTRHGIKSNTILPFSLYELRVCSERTLTCLRLILSRGVSWMLFALFWLCINT